MTRHSVNISAKVYAGNNPQVSLYINDNMVCSYGPFSSWAVAEVAAKNIIANATSYIEQEKQRMLDAIKSDRAKSS